MSDEIHITYVARMRDEASARLRAMNERIRASSRATAMSNVRDSNLISGAMTKMTGVAERNSAKMVGANIRHARSYGAVQSGMRNTWNHMNRLRESGQALTRDLASLNVRFTAMRNFLRALAFPIAIAAFGAIAQVAGAAAGAAVALTGALAPLAGALIALPIAAGAAVQAIGTFKLALSGIGDTLKANDKSMLKAEGGVANLAAKQTGAADAIHSANEQLAAANQRAADSEQNLSKARSDARRQLTDLATAAISASLAQKRAALTLEEAKADLERVQADPTSTGFAVQNAKLAVQEARAGLKSAHTDHVRANQARDVAVRKGVKGSDQVTQALREQKDAAQAVADAHRGIASAKTSGAASTAGTNAMELRAKALYDRLSKQQKQFVDYYQKNLYKIINSDLPAAAGKKFFPGLIDGIKAAMPLLKPLEHALTETGAVFGRMFRQIGKFLGSKEFGSMFKTLTQNNAKWLGQMAMAGLHLTKSLVRLMVAGQPLMDWLVKMTTHLTNNLAAWTNKKVENGGAARFFDKTRKVLEVVGPMLWDVLKAITNITKGGAKVGGELLGQLAGSAKTFSTWTASLSGKNQIASYFEAVKPTIKEVALLIKDLVKAWVSISMHDSSAVLIKALREQLLPALVKTVTLTTQAFGPAFVAMLASGAKLLGILQGPLEVVLRGLGMFLDVIGFILTKLGPLSGALKLTLSVLAAIIVGFKAIDFLSKYTGLQFGIRKLGEATGWWSKVAVSTQEATAAALEYQQVLGNVGVGGKGAGTPGGVPLTGGPNGGLRTTPANAKQIKKGGFVPGPQVGGSGFNSPKGGYYDEQGRKYFKPGQALPGRQGTSPAGGTFMYESSHPRYQPPPTTAAGKVAGRARGLGSKIPRASGKMAGVLALAGGAGMLLSAGDPLGGAVSGAMMGSVAGPWGMAGGALLGAAGSALLGALTDSKADAAQVKARKAAQGWVHGLTHDITKGINRGFTRSAALAFAVTKTRADKDLTKETGIARKDLRNQIGGGITRADLAAQLTGKTGPQNAAMGTSILKPALKNANILSKGFIKQQGGAFTDSKTLMGDFNSTFGKLNMVAQQQGASAMVEYARGMEKKGKVPKGTVEDLIKSLGKQYDGLAPIVAGSVARSARQLRRLGRDKSVVDSVGNTVSQLSAHFRQIPAATVKSVQGATATVKTDLDRLTAIARNKNLPKAMREEAAKQLPHLQTLYKQTLERMAKSMGISKDAADAWAQKVSDSVRKAGGPKAQIAALRDEVNKLTATMGAQKLLNTDLGGKSAEQLAALARQADKLGDKFPSLRKKLAAFQEDVDEKLGGKLPKILKGVHSSWDDFDTSSKHSLSNIREHVKDTTSTINSKFKGTKVGSDALAANFHDARLAIKDAMRRGKINTADGVKEMNRLLGQEYAALAVSAVDTGVERARRALAAVGVKLPTAATGGFLPGAEPGAATRDSILAYMAPGEAVLNRHQQPYVENALQNTYGMGLDGLFNQVQTPNYYASGGYIGSMTNQALKTTAKAAKPRFNEARDALLALVTGGDGGDTSGGESSTTGLVPQVKRAIAYAKKHGWDGDITSGFRSRAKQQYLWDHRASNPNPVAPPGTSNHERGRAIDTLDQAGMAHAMATAPANALLKWFGPGDPVHWSVDGRARGGFLGNIKRFASGGRVWSVRASSEDSRSGRGWTELSTNGNGAAASGNPHTATHQGGWDFATLGKAYPRGTRLHIRSPRTGKSWTGPMTDVGDGSSFAPAIGLTPAVQAALGGMTSPVHISMPSNPNLRVAHGFGTVVGGGGGGVGTHGSSPRSSKESAWKKALAKLKAANKAHAITGYTQRLQRTGMIGGDAGYQAGLSGTSFRAVLDDILGQSFGSDQTASILGAASGATKGKGATYGSGGIPRRINRVASRARALLGKPYQYGGHGNPGYDCSSFVINALNAGGLFRGTAGSTDNLKTWGESGEGKYLTVGVRGTSGRGAHTMMKVKTGQGWRYYEAGGGGSPRNVHQRNGWNRSFPIKRHAKGFAKGGWITSKGAGSGGTASLGQIVPRVMDVQPTKVQAKWNAILENLSDGVSKAVESIFGEKQAETLRRNILNQITRMQKSGGGVSANEAKIIARLRQALDVVNAGIGNYYGKIIAGVNKTVEGFDKAKTALDREDRKKGVDTSTAAAQASLSSYLNGQVTQLSTQKGILEAALKKAKGAGQKDIAKDIQEQIDGLSDTIDETATQAIEAQMASIVAAATDAANGVTGRISEQNTGFTQALRRQGIDSSSSGALSWQAGMLQGQTDDLTRTRTQLYAQLSQVPSGSTSAKAITDQIKSIQDAIDESTTSYAETIRAAAEAKAQEAVNDANHAGTMQSLAQQNLSLQQQLDKTFDTSAGKAARSQFITSTIIPGLTGELTALQSQLATVKDVDPNNKALADQIAEAIAGKQNDLLQAQLEAQQAIEENTASLKDQAGTIGFQFQGQEFTDLIGVGTGL